MSFCLFRALFISSSLCCSVFFFCLALFLSFCKQITSFSDVGDPRTPAFPRETGVTWQAAEERCRGAGARLASLGTFREMRDVRAVLYSTGSPYVMIGMTPMEISAPYV